eukprot:3403130-Prymnesium_polylepis.4
MRGKGRRECFAGTARGSLKANDLCGPKRQDVAVEGPSQRFVPRCLDRTAHRQGARGNCPRLQRRAGETPRGGVGCGARRGCSPQRSHPRDRPAEGVHMEDHWTVHASPWRGTARLLRCVGTRRTSSSYTGAPSRSEQSLESCQKMHVPLPYATHNRTVRQAQQSRTPSGTSGGSSSKRRSSAKRAIEKSHWKPSPMPNENISSPFEHIWLKRHTSRKKISSVASARRARQGGARCGSIGNDI